jgi:hypothetical protein
MRQRIGLREYEELANALLGEVSKQLRFLGLVDDVFDDRERNDPPIGLQELRGIRVVFGSNSIELC